MSYFKDLTSFTYCKEEDDALNIGFLSGSHKFVRGPIPREILHTLIELTKTLYIQHRGCYVCDICEPTTEVKSNSEYLSAWESTRHGSALFRVVSKSGQAYIAPTLIVHYITEHQYRPPDEYLEAVVGMTVKEYIEKINKQFSRYGSQKYPDQ